MSLIMYMLMLAKLAAVGAYIIDLKVVNFPFNTAECRSMKLCYSYDRFCNTGLRPKKCLMDLSNNMIDINTASAITGKTKFYEFKKEHDLGDSPKIMSVILNQQGEEVVYCEDPGSRNESGSNMFVHLESTATNFSSIDIELKSNCDDSEHCTGVVCNRCYDRPPIVTISVLEPVIIDDNATIICRILPLTRDTQILWFISNGTYSRTIHDSEKNQVTTSMSMNSSFLTIYSVQHEDELNYSCQAINFMKKGISKRVKFNATEFTTENITSIDHNLTTSNLKLSSNFPSFEHSSKRPSTMKFSTTPKMISSTMSISSTLIISKLKSSSTSKYTIILSSEKETKPSTSRISSSAKSTASLTNVKSVHTAITKGSNVPPSVTQPSGTFSLAVSSTGKSTTISPTVKASGTITSTVTKSLTVSPHEKTRSTIVQALRSTEENHNINLWMSSVIVVLEFIIIILLVYQMCRKRRHRLKRNNVGLTGLNRVNEESSVQLC